MHLSDHMLWYNPQLYCSLTDLLNWRVYLNQTALPQNVYKIYPKLQRLLMGILVPSLLSGDSVCPMSVLYLPDWWTKQARTHPCSVSCLGAGALMVLAYPVKSDGAEGGTWTVRAGLWCLLVGKLWVLFEASTSGIFLCFTILHTL